MQSIKSYTNLEQSRKLAEILPIESADMCCFENQDGSCNYYGFPYTQANKASNPIPCWSLAALLDVIPKHIKDYNTLRIDISENEFAIWYDEIGYGVNNELPDITKESAIDACVAMIEKLHELNLL